MCRLLLMLIFCASQFMLFAQDSFSPNELQSFASIYMAQKDLRIDKQSEMLALMDKYQLSAARYREIMQKSLKGADLKLSESEQAFIDGIQQLNEEAVVEKRQGLTNDVVGLNQLCEKHNLAYSAYSAILKQYKSDIKFQRSLKPYFETFIKGN